MQPRAPAFQSAFYATSAGSFYNIYGLTNNEVNRHLYSRVMYGT